MAKKLLVTGSLGFMGKNLIEKEFLEREKIDNEEFEVLAADTKSMIDLNKKYIEKIISGYSKMGKKISYVASDLTKPETLEDIVKNVDKIFHIAAVFDYTAPWDLLYNVNVKGTENLLQAVLDAEEAGMADIDHIVAWGSTVIYGRPEKLYINENAKKIPNLEELRERTEKSEFLTDEILVKKNKMSRYEISKREQRDLILSYSEKLPVTIIHPSATYGEGSFNGLANYLMAAGSSNAGKRMFAKFLPAKNLLMQGSYVGDIVKAAVFLSEQKWTAEQEYIVADKNAVKIKDALKFVAKEIGIRKPFIPASGTMMRMASYFTEKMAEKKAKKTGKKVYPIFPKDTVAYFLYPHTYSVDKLASTGYAHVGSFEENIRKTISWYRENGYIVDKRKKN